MLNRAQSLTF